MQCFPRSLRLITKKDYQFTFNHSKKVSSRFLLVLYRSNEKKNARLGLVISKRVAKHAVTRNQIKRVIRESFRLHQQNMEGFDVIVIAKTQCDKLSKNKLREGIDQLWEKLPTQYQHVLSK
jgi:ribonuclease P protein component